MSKANFINKYGFFVNDAVTYGLILAFSKCAALISTFILARYLKVEEYGVFDYYLVLSVAFVSIFAFGQDSAIARFFYEYDDDPSRKQLISQSLFFQLIVSFFMAPFVLLLDYFVNFTPLNDNSFEYLFVIVLMVPFIILFNSAQNILKWTFDKLRFIFLTIGLTIVQAFSIISSIIYFEVTILFLLKVILYCYIASSLVAIFFIRKWIVFPSNFKYIFKTLHYALPYAFISIIASILPLLERTIINNYFDNFQLGLYSIALRIVLVASLFVTAFQTAWGPFSLSHYKNNSINLVESTFNPILTAYIFAYCSLALIVSGLSPWLISFIASDKYINSVPLVFPLIMALGIHSMGLITEFGIDIAMKSHYKIYAYLINFIVTIVGIFVFISFFDIVGVSLGVLLGSISRTLFVTIISQKINYLPWSFFGSVVIIVVTLITGLSSVIFHDIFDSSNRFLVFTVGFISLQFLFWFYFLNFNLRRIIFIYIKNLFHKFI